jgi:hypothetical protein
MGKQESGSDVVHRLRQAESEKNWQETVYILDHIDTLTEEDIRALEPVLPRLILHRYYVIRAGAVEVVGLFQLRQFLDLVEARLDDRNKDVRSYALEAYYDLLGGESLPAVRKYCEDRSLRVRVTALSVCYAATGDETCLARLEKILLRRDCDYHLRFVALNTLDYYMDVSRDPRAIGLFRSILERAGKSRGIAVTIRTRLAEWEKKAK